MKKLRTVEDLAKEWMKDPKFRKEYEALEPRYALAAAVIEARIKANLSQKELARRMKTTQPMIARMEGGRQPPSTATLFRLAKATGTKLQIKFVEA
jgi:ribosome-binding protein aMBF1 (putative translation factor)